VNLSGFFMVFSFRVESLADSAIIAISPPKGKARAASPRVRRHGDLKARLEPDRMEAGQKMNPRTTNWQERSPCWRNA